MGASLVPNWSVLTASHGNIGTKTKSVPFQEKQKTIPADLKTPNSDTKRPIGRCTKQNSTQDTTRLQRKQTQLRPEMTIKSCSKPPTTNANFPPESLLKQSPICGCSNLSHRCECSNRSHRCHSHDNTRREHQSNVHERKRARCRTRAPSMCPLLSECSCGKCNSTLDRNAWRFIRPVHRSVSQTQTHATGPKTDPFEMFFFLKLTSLPLRLLQTMRSTFPSRTPFRVPSLRGSFLVHMRSGNFLKSRFASPSVLAMSASSLW